MSPEEASRRIAMAIQQRKSRLLLGRVAVQSHWFSVGPIVPFAEAGIGAVATQSFVDPNYGPLGLELMRSGRSAAQALHALVSTDDNENVRQVAMVDAFGYPTDPIQMSNGLKATIGTGSSRYGLGSGIDLWASEPAMPGSLFQPAFRLAR